MQNALPVFSWGIVNPSGFALLTHLPLHRGGFSIVAVSYYTPAFSTIAFFALLGRLS